MKCTAEIRFLLVSVVVLMALVVPVTAATFATDTPAATDAGAAPSTAGTGLIVDEAPPPLLFMALGSLLVVAMIGRRARRVALAPLPDARR